jgi:hypothetical protein
MTETFRHQRSGFDGRRSMAVKPRSSKIGIGDRRDDQGESNDNV